MLDALRGVWASVWPLVVGIAVAAAMHFVLPSAIGPFYTRIVIDIGIAMILAVSLNIVNGMTGQFSSATPRSWRSAATRPAWSRTTARCCCGAAGQNMADFSAAANGCFSPRALSAESSRRAGYVVGLPSLRLRGDYLAIVTLGFGEICALFCSKRTMSSKQPTLSARHRSPMIPPPVGGALGFHGMPKYTNLFWVYAFVAHAGGRVSLEMVEPGSWLISVREDEFAAQAMGVNVARVRCWPS